MTFAKDVLMEFTTNRCKYSHFMELAFAKTSWEKAGITFAKDILMKFTTDRFKYSHFMEIAFAKLIWKRQG